MLHYTVSNGTPPTSRYGDDTAWQIVAHSRRLKVLETSYLKFADKVALVSLAVNEDERDELEAIQDRANRATLEQLSVEQVAQARGPAFQEL